MPASQPRISAVLEKPLYEAIRKLASKDKMSVSQKARDLLAEAIELYEDQRIGTIVEERMKKSKRGYSVDEAKKRLGLR